MKDCRISCRALWPCPGRRNWVEASTRW